MGKRRSRQRAHHSEGPEAGAHLACVRSRSCASFSPWASGLCTWHPLQVGPRGLPPPGPRPSDIFPTLPARPLRAALPKTRLYLPLSLPFRVLSALHCNCVSSWAQNLVANSTGPGVSLSSAHLDPGSATDLPCDPAEAGEGCVRMPGPNTQEAVHRNQHYHYFVPRA